MLSSPVTFRKLHVLTIGEKRFSNGFVYTIEWELRGFNCNVVCRRLCWPSRMKVWKLLVSNTDTSSSLYRGWLPLSRPSNYRHTKTSSDETIDPPHQMTRQTWKIKITFSFLFCGSVGCYGGELTVCRPNYIKMIVPSVMTPSYWLIHQHKQDIQSSNSTHLL